MRTPAGTECPYYYEDFYRGREKQVCRLIERTPQGGQWTPDMCANCSVPRIIRANACPHLVLEAKAHSGFLGIGKRVEVAATCTKSLKEVDEPEIGCGLCHEAMPFFEIGDDKT